MRPYRLKHLPTGLYYQPYRHGGSNLSKKGKIYQTSVNGIPQHLKEEKLHPDRNTFQVFAHEDCLVYKQTKEVLKWSACRWTYNKVFAETLLLDWVIEEI